MALLDTLSAITASAPATKNRVEILLDTLDGDDLHTLESALRNQHIRGSDLTKALKKEYGNDVVTDRSVGDWRRRHPVELTGL